MHHHPYCATEDERRIRCEDRIREAARDPLEAEARYRREHPEAEGDRIVEVAMACWRAGCDEQDGPARIEAIIRHEVEHARRERDAEWTHGLARELLDDLFNWEGTPLEWIEEKRREFGLEEK